ncbi:MAG: phosphate/phosphite/phosphonate ABC transporter substrate-binding protein [Algicola sp.]|nr:phosphate/phosphite/phosphonate ABC transporter substrate-binding protein [Algicola sp.]
MKKLDFKGLLLVLVTLLFGCSDVDSTANKTLYIGVLPDLNEAMLHKKYQGLVTYLQTTTNIKCQLKVPGSYNQLLRWFNNKEVDIALFGGVTFVKAQRKASAEPLVMRAIDARFKSVMLVRAKNPANGLSELKGGTLAFGSRLSTSGHYMPRYFFQKQQITPENLFQRIEYSGAHDTTALWVERGKVDAGVANAQIVYSMLEDGRLNKDKVKIIWQSPPFADYVWAVQSTMSEQYKQLLRDAFLSMSQHPEQQPLLDALGADYYIPSRAKDFAKLAQVVPIDSGR